jgi:murein DD-endopeptidase MepM/ murein hydrolase activator NlpD
VYYNILILFLIIANAIHPIPLVSYPTTKNARISQHFGYKGHVGVDFDVKVGTPVYAVLAGKVITALEDERVYGRSIMILHDVDGYASLYGHLSKLLVHKGEYVVAGQLIGLSGGNPNDNIDGDGMSSGAHLHFEIRVPGHLDNNLYNIDPLQYLDKYMNNCLYWDNTRCN